MKRSKSSRALFEALAFLTFFLFVLSFLSSLVNAIGGNRPKLILEGTGLGTVIIKLIKAPIPVVIGNVREGLLLIF